MYKNSEEVDDEISIREITAGTDRNLRKLARKQWVSKILGGRSCCNGVDLLMQ